MLDGRLDLPDVETLHLAACGERPENVLFLLLGVNRHFLRAPQRHKAVVGAIQRVIPSLLPREVILDVRINL